MNTELIPAAVAATGGAALIGGIAAHEYRRDAQMRAQRQRLSLRFPMAMEPAAALGALRGLSGLDWRNELIAEVTASEHAIRHALLIPRPVENAASRGLATALPGLRLNPFELKPGSTTLAVKLFLPTPLVLHEGDPAAGSGALLAALGVLRGSETVSLRWALEPSRPRHWAPREDGADRETQAARQLWQRKLGGTGFRVAGLLLVRAQSRARARQLAGGVIGAIRARENRVGIIRPTFNERGRPMGAVPKVTRSSGWLTLGELLPLLGWPLGDEVVPGLELGGARERLVPRGVPDIGRVLFIGRDGRGDRSVALTTEAARHHMAVIGPSGSGKSVLIGRSILDDLHAGFGGVVLDPKADLVDDVLNRVSAGAADRVVVLDPADRRPVPGLDLLGAGDPDLRTDVLVGALAAIFTDSFGIRSQLYLRLGLRTLAEIPDATVADLARLFFDASYRAGAVGRLSDPVLAMQWQAFAALSPTAQAEHVQSPLAKVSALVSRPAVRSILAAPTATIDIAGLLAEHKWLFISLSPGRLGEPASRLLGSVLMYAVWSAIEARASLPPAARRPVFIYVDELSTIATMPFSLEHLLERSRGLGAGITMAAQSLARIPESLRSSLLGNVATLVTFRAGADEASRLARELPGMDARDLQALGRFEVAARIGTGTGSAVTVVTGRSQAWPEPTGLGAGAIRDRSAERYGAPPELAKPVPEMPAAEEIGRVRKPI